MTGKTVLIIKKKSHLTIYNIAAIQGTDITIHVSKNRYFITYCKSHNIYIIKMPEKHSGYVYSAIKDSGTDGMT